MNYFYINHLKYLYKYINIGHRFWDTFFPIYYDKFQPVVIFRLES